MRSLIVAAALLATFAAAADGAGRANGPIAFIRVTGNDASLMAIRANATGEHEVARGFPGHRPFWVVAGRPLAGTYRVAPCCGVGGRRPPTDLYVIRADGAAMRALTHTAATEDEPAWSPDGGAIAFVRGVARGKRISDLYVVEPDGRGLRRLTHLSSVSGPAWSPDGRSLAFALWRYPGASGSSAATAAACTASPRAPRASGSAGRRGRPTARASHSRPALESRAAPSGSCASTAACGARWRWTSAPAPGTHGRPDGSRIVFAPAGGGVAVVSTDGSGQQRLSRLGSADGFSWSPDGRLIAFASSRTGQGDIYVIRSDGNGLRRLTISRDAEYGPAWASR